MADPRMPNGRRSWRAIRLALSTQPLQIRKTAVSGVVSSVAVSSRRLWPSAAWRAPLSATYSPSPPIQSSPLKVLRTLSGSSSQVCSISRCTAREKLRTATMQEEEPDDAKAGVGARGRGEDVADRLGAASGQVVTVDDAVGRALPSELRRQGARDDRQRDQGRERSGGQRDRAVESRHLLKPVDHAQHELGPQPERQRPHDALAIHPPPPVRFGGIVARHG